LDQRGAVVSESQRSATGLARVLTSISGSRRRTFPLRRSRHYSSEVRLVVGHNAHTRARRSPRSLWTPGIQTRALYFCERAGGGARTEGQRCAACITAKFNRDYRCAFGPSFARLVISSLIVSSRLQQRVGFSRLQQRVGTQSNPHGTPRLDNSYWSQCSVCCWDNECFGRTLEHGDSMTCLGLLTH